MNIINPKFYPFITKNNQIVKIIGKHNEFIVTDGETTELYSIEKLEKQLNLPPEI